MLAVGHLGELVLAYLSHRDELLSQIDLSYVHESEPLGTAGALSLVPGLSETFLVMNGDVLTDLNFIDLLAFHQRSGAELTIATHNRVGRESTSACSSSADDRVVGYLEKPTYSYSVSMGIYVFEPTVLDCVEPGVRLEFPDLVLRLLADNRHVAAYVNELTLARHRPTRRLRLGAGARCRRPRSLPLVSGWRIPLSDLNYDDLEERAARGPLSTRWLSMGPEVQSFEEEFAALVDVPHAIAVSSGTAALHLAYVALGIGPGDEVIQPAMNFVAAANMTTAIGATPVFADILAIDEPTISPAHATALVGPNTRAIVVMHYGGNACRMNEILELARARGVAVIEDACHAVGATYGPDAGADADRPVGSLGDISCFSFFSNKNLATGEGGMVTTNDDDLARRVRLLRSHGMTTLTWDRHLGHATSYDVVTHGFNYRLDDLRAALGRVQLSKLAAGNQRRRELVARYDALAARLADVPHGAYPSRRQLASSDGRGRKGPADARRRRGGVDARRRADEPPLPVHHGLRGFRCLLGLRRTDLPELRRANAVAPALSQPQPRRRRHDRRAPRHGGARSRPTTSRRPTTLENRLRLALRRPQRSRALPARAR